MMKKIQKALAICMSVACIAGYSTPALAASTNVNSVGSVVADAAADDQSENNYGSQGIVGKDETQQKESDTLHMLTLIKQLKTVMLHQQMFMQHNHQLSQSLHRLYS